ncbi:MAG: hypothetical protein KC777_10035 [Cyanobacteria bacterium HKST-UBA02]|nr:hypothetical protein [Cyanobacteria bacterium HKST-UBA02]
MSDADHLTDRQLVEFSAARAERSRLLIDSTAPADRDMTTRGLRVLYWSAGVELPPVIWVANPRLAAVAAALVARMYGMSDRETDWKAISQVAKYIETQGDEIAAFPELHSQFNVLWEFAQRSWIPQEEYTRVLVWCCNFSFAKGRRRSRDIWDVITSRAEASMPGEFDEVCQSLLSELSGTDIGAAVGGLVNPDRLVTERAIKRSVDWLFDRRRIYTSGVRDLLCELGKYSYKPDGLPQVIASCGGFIPFDDVVIAVERPSVIRRDDRGRLHNTDGMSIEYGDGWGCYSLSGMTVDEPRIVTHKEEITVGDILSEYNAEIRRVMIEFYGMERFVRDSQAELVDDHPDFGVLYRTTIARDEPVATLKVMNSTPEPDGTFKTYFLQVHPRARTAREAVAWTFGMREEEYAPSVET